MAIVSRKMFGKSGRRSIACAEAEEVDTQIGRLDFLWTGHNTPSVLPQLAGNPNYMGDVRAIQRQYGLVASSFR